MAQAVLFSSHNETLNSPNSGLKMENDWKMENDSRALPFERGKKNHTFSVQHAKIEVRGVVAFGWPKKQNLKSQLAANLKMGNCCMADIE